MRRAEREIADRTEIDTVIRGCRVCRLAFAAHGEPYIVPLSFGYDGVAFYFHTAPAGKKIDCIETDPRVCFELERDVRLGGEDNDPCSWTFSYESVIGYGTLVELAGTEERVFGLNRIMEHYTGREWEFGPEMLEGTRIWRLEIESMTGKRSRQGPQRRESE
jgi:nitroimidazol reductase NimA-like FMN-containing flavoprotein (pyridoxamine 5'-phosphate oxidase superfamily)